MSDSMEIDDDNEEFDSNPANDSKLERNNGKKRSILWKHFTVLDEKRAKCNFCSMIFSYKTSISNLKIHLIRKHNHVKVPGTQYTPNRQKIPETGIKRPRDQSSERKWNNFRVKVAHNSIRIEDDEVVQVIPPPAEQEEPDRSSINIVAAPKALKESKQRDSFMFGCSDFSTMADKSWYVDKTLFLRATLKECDRLLITTPKRCGKTTNLSMLKRFVEIETDKNGDPIQLQLDSGMKFLSSQQVSTNFKLFINRKIFRGARIAKDSYNKNFFTKYFGRYPVIYITFKNVLGNSFEEMLEQLRTTLYMTFREHRYLLQSRIWDNEDGKVIFEKYVNAEKYHEIPEEKLKYSLRFLSEMLCEHFSQKNKVYVIIDDLGKPIDNIIHTRNVSTDISKKIINFIKNMLSYLLKDNPHVERVLAIAGNHYSHLLLSDCNVIHKPYMQSDISKYFGFTNEEVEHILSDMDLTDSLNEVKVWYNGYGLTLNNGDIVEIYNNWSVLQYLYENEFKNYQPLGNLNRFKNALNSKILKEQIEILLSRRSITVRYKSSLSLSDVFCLKDILTISDFLMTDDHVNLFFQFLYETGYLNHLYRTEETIELVIPNIEIYSEYCRFFFSFDFFKDYNRINDEILNNFVQSVSNFKTVRNQKSFIEFACAINNLFMNTKILPQNDFELQALLHHVMKKFFPNIKGEALTMPKRFLKCDIALPIDDKIGIIMEVTTYDRGTSLDALGQIVSNKYNEILSFDGLTDEIYIGLHLAEDRKVSISYLINNFDLAFADTVSSCDGKLNCY